MTTEPRPAPAADPSGVEHRLAQLLALFAWLAAIALALEFFSATKMILLGLLGAAIVASALKPLTDRVPAKRWPSAVLVGLIPVLVAVGLFALLGRLLFDVVERQASRWPEMRQTIDEMLTRWGQRFGLEQELTVAGIGERLLDSVAGGVGSGGGEGAISAAAGWLAGSLIAIVLVLFGTMFLLAEPRARLLGGVQRLLPARRRPQLDAVVEELEPRLRWWLLGQSFSMVVTGLTTWAGLALIGLPFAAPLALVAGIAEIVPNIGPAVAFLVVLLVAATQGGAMVWKAVAVWAVVQLVESYVLVPWVMKRAVHVPPLVTLFSVVLWGNVFGIPGLLLAIPIDLVVWSFARHFLAREDVAAGAPARAGPAGGQVEPIPP